MRWALISSQLRPSNHFCNWPCAPPASAAAPDASGGSPLRALTRPATLCPLRRLVTDSGSSGDEGVTERLAAQHGQLLRMLASVQGAREAELKQRAAAYEGGFSP